MSARTSSCPEVHTKPVRSDAFQGRSTGLSIAELRAEPELEQQSSTPPSIHLSGPLAPAPPPEASHGPSSPPQRYVAEPEEEEQQEQAAVTHVLLCCDHSLRLYPAEGIRTGERLAPHPGVPSSLYLLCRMQSRLGTCLTVLTSQAFPSCDTSHHDAQPHVSIAGISVASSTAFWS